MPKVKYKKNGDWNDLDFSSGGSGSASIDDTNTSVDKTWSSDKINKQFQTIANEIENIGSPTQEQINTAIDKAIEDGKISVSSIAIGNRVPTNGEKYWLDTRKEFSIKETLNNCSSNNTNETCMENDSYIATIIPNNGYALSTVVVIMNNIDITNEVYSEGEINITEVTGDIVITCTATEESTATTTYSITNNLTNCTNSNSSTTVEENSSYSATITANEGYTLGDVTVTMGDTDITSTSVSNGVISINSITGDIVITCTATQSSTGTDRSQYLDDETNILLSNKSSISINKTEFDALTNEKLYLVVYTTNKYMCTVNVGGMYTPTWGSASLTSTYEINEYVTAIYNHVESDGYFVGELNVQAIKTGIQGLCDDGTIDTTKGNIVVTLGTNNNQKTGLKVLYSYVD